MKRVLWLCTFSSEEKRSHLQLWRRQGGESGQWIPSLLSAFESEGGLELHVASTENYMVRSYQAWTSRNIRYHCFKSGVPLIGRNWPACAPVDHMTDFWVNRRRIRTIVERVKPDLIHLFGVENPQYGAAVLDVLGRTPVLVTIQGFVHRERCYHDDYFTGVRCRYERQLLESCHSFSGDYDSEAVVRAHNPSASYRHLYFPVNEALIEKVSREKSDEVYDLLFVGALTRQKGIFDFLDVARTLVTKGMPLRAAIVGTPENCPAAVEQIVRHGLAEHIVWVGRFPTQEGLFRVFRQSKILLVPTYNDCFPSIIRESMLLRTPVISYATGGIPWVNRTGAVNVELVKQGDWSGMAAAAATLLGDGPKRSELRARALAFAREEFSLRANAEVIRKAYWETMEQA